jgi:hypothetical protein
MVQVDGDGHALAIQIRGQQLPQDLQAYQPQAAINTIPPNWNHHVIGLRTNDIYRLMIFYNVDFDIVAGDSLTEKREKVLLWLTEWA